MRNAGPGYRGGVIRRWIPFPFPFLFVLRLLVVHKLAQMNVDNATAVVHTRCTMISQYFHERFRCLYSQLGILINTRCFVHHSKKKKKTDSGTFNSWRDVRVRCNLFLAHFFYIVLLRLAKVFWWKRFSYVTLTK